MAVDLDRAADDVIEAADQIDDGRLACAGRADERNGLAGLDMEGNVFEDDLFLVVGEGDVLKVHAAFDGRQVISAFLILNVAGRIHDFEDSLHGGHGGEQVVIEVGKNVQRLPEAAQIPQDQKEVGQIQRVGRAGHEDHTEVVDQHGAEGADEIKQRPEGAVDLNGLHPRGADVAGDVFEGGEVFLLTDERLRDADARHGFMQIAVHVRALDADALPSLAHDALDLEQEDQQKRDDAHADQRQLPVDHQHDDQEHYKRQTLDEDVHDAVGEQVVQGIDVVDDADQDFAGRAGIEEGEAQALNVVE